MDKAKIWEIFAIKYKQDFVNLVSSPYLSWADLLKKLTDAVAGAKYADPTTAKVALNRFPNQTSIKSLIHLGQLIQHGEFMEMQD